MKSVRQQWLWMGIGGGMLLAITLMAVSCMSPEITANPPSATPSAEISPRVVPDANPRATPPPTRTRIAPAAPPADPTTNLDPACGTGCIVDPQLITRPAGTRRFQANQSALLAEGETLWNDRSLGTNGLACGICHLNNDNFSPTFLQSYPHTVAMPLQMAGRSQVDIDEMVQFCLVQLMVGSPLPWASRQLAALTVYSLEVQRQVIEVTAAPPGDATAMKNPCQPRGTQAHPQPGQR